MVVVWAPHFAVALLPGAFRVACSLGGALQKLLELLPVLVVADLFHPVDNFPVESLLNRDVRHRHSRACAVPMLLSRLEPDDIAGPDFFDQAGPSLDQANTGCNEQRLPKRMRMPRRSGAGFEGDARTPSTRWIGRLE